MIIIGISENKMAKGKVSFVSPNTQNVKIIARPPSRGVGVVCAD